MPSARAPTRRRCSARPGTLVEGALTAAAVMRLAARHAVEVPICAAVDAILAGRLDIATALEALMTRPISDRSRTLISPRRTRPAAGAESRRDVWAQR